MSVARFCRGSKLCMHTSQLTVQGVGISALVTGALSSGTITSSMLSLHHSITEYVDADPSNSSAYSHNYVIWYLV